MIGFGILLTEESHNLVRRLEVDLQNNFDVSIGLKQSPHITFKRPFVIDQLAPYEKYFDKISKEIKSLQIVIDGIGYFAPNVIFLNVAPNRELDILHRTVLSDLKREFEIPEDLLEGENMKFHVTLAYDDFSPETFRKAQNYLSDVKDHLAFMTEEIGLFYKVDDSWIIYKKINIDNHKTAP